jgi:hypothetical protein
VALEARPRPTSGSSRGDRLCQLGVLADDGASTCLQVIADGGEGGVGVEDQEGVPRDTGPGLKDVVAVPEPTRDLQLRVAELRDPRVSEDELRVTAALAVAFEGQPDRQDLDVDLRSSMKDVVGDPTGALQTGASSG